jgi:uncharacterized protein (DUF1778 family)
MAEPQSSLEKVAQLQAQSLDAFALKPSHDAATPVLVDQTRFLLTSRPMKILNLALEAPGRDLPGLKRLFSRPSVLT